MPRFLRGFGFLVVALLPACGSLPAQGPSTAAILGDRTPPEVSVAAPIDYRLVQIDAAVANRHGTQARAHFSSGLRGGSPVDRDLIAEGDALEIWIWEAGPDGLFASADRRDVRIAATVASDGTVQVPYAGQVIARGVTPAQLRTRLAKALEGKALAPEIQVTRVSSDGLAVSVLGDVNRPGRVDLPTGKTALLDVIALAGGQSAAAWETEVTVIRASRRETVRLDTVFATPWDNLVLHPGDTLHVAHDPRSYAAFGAVQRPGERRFDKDRVALSDVLAGAGGLSDARADASAVFLFRLESPDRFGATMPLAPLIGDRLPVIYQLDLTRADAFFLARSFEIADGDILYVANAAASELRKFVSTVLSPLVFTANSVGSVAE